MSKKWFVSRQCYWGVDDEDRNVVEIAAGGLDYANADMLVARWSNLGEGGEYTDPREALKAAKSVRDAWIAVAPDDQVHIEVGATGGYTMPFTMHPTDKQLDQWATTAWIVAPKCDRCGEVLPEAFFVMSDGVSDDKFCSERCAEMSYEDMMSEEADVEDEGEE